MGRVDQGCGQCSPEVWATQAEGVVNVDWRCGQANVVRAHGKYPSATQSLHKISFTGNDSVNRYHSQGQKQVSSRGGK